MNFDSYRIKCSWWQEGAAVVLIRGYYSHLEEVITTEHFLHSRICSRERGFFQASSRDLKQIVGLSLEVS